MKIPVWICSLLLAAAIGVEGWCLHEIISLKVSVAEIRAQVIPAGRVTNDAAALAQNHK